MEKPLILVTNDDGMFAPGLRALVEVVKGLGEVIVVAPDSPQSGQGHAITLNDPIRINEVSVFDGCLAYECSGTPADCVKLAKAVVCKGRTIALCVSGINHGSNASINIIYSGTMSAAMEASLDGIPSIGFSLMDYSFEADFTAAKFFASQLIKTVLREGMGATKLLNVNIPKLDQAEIKGFRVCRQAKGNWTEEFKEAKDPRGKSYYWMTGAFTLEDEGTDTDIWALENNYISIVPSMSDLTHFEALAELSEINMNEV